MLPPASNAHCGVTYVLRDHGHDHDILISVSKDSKHERLTLANCIEELSLVLPYNSQQIIFDSALVIILCMCTCMCMYVHGAMNVVL